MCIYVFFFFFKQKTAYEMLRSLVGSEMCIRDRSGSVEVDGVGVEAALRAVRAGASITAALREQCGVVGGRRYQALAAELRGRLTSGV